MRDKAGSDPFILNKSVVTHRGTEFSENQGVIAYQLFSQRV